MASESKQSLAATDINPYQTPQHGDHPPQPIPHEADSPPTSSEPLRFWEGRKALLKSLFYMRCWSLVTALVALRTVYVFFDTFIRPDGEFWNGPSMYFADPWTALYFLATVLILLLTLAIAYIVWQYARCLQQVVSRREPNPTELCQQHLLCWRLKVALVAALLLQQGIFYMQQRAFMSQFDAMTSEDT